MKKFILGATFVASSLMADVSTILPYAGYINYDSNINKSTKDTASLFGIHYSKGNLSYLFELDYSHLNSVYKSQYESTPFGQTVNNPSDLKQDDFVIAYSNYKTNYMSKVGYHYVSTNDETLGDGHIFNYTIGGYKWKGYDKYSLGLESYYSIYSDGHDENYDSKAINIFQFTPYVSFYQGINVNTSNTISLKLNYEIATDYVDTDYVSYEFSDTFAYKKFFTTASFYTGESRTGVKDGGSTVFNSLDLMKTGYNLKVGYYLKPNTILTFSYGANTYREYKASSDGTNNVMVTSLSYNF